MMLVALARYMTEVTFTYTASFVEALEKWVYTLGSLLHISCLVLAQSLMMVKLYILTEADISS